MINPFPAAEVFLNWLLKQSIQAGVLVLLVVLVQKIFRRQLTSRWRFALWWVVLIRLILPFGPESALSVFNLWHPSINVAGIPSVMRTQPHDSDFGGEEKISYEPYFTRRNQIQIDEVIQGNESQEPAHAVAAGNPTPNPSHPTHLKMRRPPSRVAFGFAVLWVSGAIALGICVLFQLIRFNRKLRQSAREPDENLSRFLMQCQRQFGITRRIELLETNAVKSPALFGLFRLKLLLPKGLAGQFTSNELRYIFLHELAHVKRCDLWLNWLVTFLQIVHWFNPLIWLGFARLRADRELACDELALVRAGEKVGTAYGETVIKLLEGASRPAAIPGLVGILEDKKQMRRRIQMIANFRRPGRWSALAVLLLIALAAAALTNAQTKPEGQETLHLQMQTDAEATKGFKGTIVLPNGKPVANAQVAIRIGDVPITIDHSESPPSIKTYGSGFMARTDENGGFILPYRERAKELVISHEKGFARTELNAATNGLLVTLEPWSGIQGMLRVNNHPGSNEWIALQSLALTNGLVLRNYQDQTYASGAFSIDHVPPGEYRLSRWVQQGEHITLAHPLGSFTLKPGLMTQVSVGGDGIPIFGKLIFSKPSDAGTNLNLNAWLESPNTPSRRYPVVISSTGQFDADDIPSGEYILNLHATAPINELPTPKSIHTWSFTSAPKKVLVPDSSPENAAAGVNVGEVQMKPAAHSSIAR